MEIESEQCRRRSGLLSNFSPLLSNPVMPDVIGLGELLWDCFPDKRRPGGAPANVAFHAQQLGLTAGVATRVGVDRFGDELIAFLQQQGLSTDLVQRDPLHGTGTVTVQPQPDGSTRYEFLADSAWDFLELTPVWRSALGSARAVCFGTLAQRCPTSRATMTAALSAVAPACLVVYDVNLRPPFVDRAWVEASLPFARVLKLNDDELRVLAAWEQSPALTPNALAERLLERHPQLELVCVTRGAHGALAVTRSEVVDEPGRPVQVVDTVGAGDAFTAALITGRLHGWPLAPALRFATQVGGLVASHAGAMPELRAEFATCQIDCGFR